jgi:hypothetical protein
VASGFGPTIDAGCGPNQQSSMKAWFVFVLFIDTVPLDANDPVAA